jgi:phosphoglycolate phosphatase-like HAD superfamily hydrolase
MTQSTVKFHNRIVLAFDFDETLAPSTFDRVLQYCGYDPVQFDEENIQPLIKKLNAEKPLASTYALVTALQRDGKRLTEADLAQIGRDFPLYNGVPEMFDRVRQAAHAIVDDIDVRFYLITAGFAEVPQNTAIAHEFNAILGGAYHFEEDGNLATAKRTITHAEKTRYLLQIAKGLELDSANPMNVYQPRDPGDWLAPVDQMIYLGDGSSDLPAFQFMRERGGIAIGIFDGDSPEEWEAGEQVHERRRVENLAPNTYVEGSELLTSIILATESIAKRIALRKLGYGE